MVVEQFFTQNCTNLKTKKKSSSQIRKVKKNWRNNVRNVRMKHFLLSRNHKFTKIIKLIKRKKK